MMSHEPAVSSDVGLVLSLSIPMLLFPVGLTLPMARSPRESSHLRRPDLS
jgi:hypothetical protein